MSDEEKCPKCGDDMKIACADALCGDPLGDITYHAHDYVHEIDGQDCLERQLVLKEKELTSWKENALMCKRDLDNIKDHYKQQKNTINKLPRYADTGEPFVPGVDAGWVVITGSDGEDSIHDTSEDDDLLEVLGERPRRLAAAGRAVPGELTPGAAICQETQQ